jgi:hypothetical protein
MVDFLEAVDGHLESFDHQKCAPKGCHSCAGYIFAAGNSIPRLSTVHFAHRLI